MKKNKNRVMIDDLMKMTVKQLLEEFCILYSPECDYNYGIGRWDDADKIWEEFDMDDKYCFSGDSLIPLDYDFFEGEETLNIDDLRCLMYKLGIPKRQACPKCKSEKYHYSYTEDCMVCEECGYKGEPEYMEIEEGE